MLRKILLFFGIYDLRQEGIIFVKENIGEEWLKDFTTKYDNINKGLPIGNYIETLIFLRMIDDIKEIAESKCWRNRLKRLFIRDKIEWEMTTSDDEKDN